MLEQLAKFPPNSYYCFVMGKGPEERFVREAFASGKVSGEYLGYLSPDELGKRLVESDVYISATLNDPFTRTLSEALVCGCFILASIYDDGTHDLIRPRENGLIFDPADEKSFRENLEFIMSSRWVRPDREKVARSLSIETDHYARQVSDAVCDALSVL